jgi:hypothetical protein
MKFWAKRGRTIAGPHETRDLAVAEFIAANPWRGPAYAASSPRNKIMSGYGEFGPSFDLRWHHANETESAHG